MSELKPCPFCGGEATYRDFTDPFTNGWIGCQKCHCFIDWVKDGKQIAIDTWNQRAENPNPIISDDEVVGCNMGEYIRHLSDEDLSKFLSDTFCHGFSEKELLNWLRGD